MTDTREATIAAIAREVLHFLTLEERRRDALDFRDVGVLSVREALERAYEAGRLDAAPHGVECPACGRSIETRRL
jgi:hypothetical protein